MHNVWPLVPLKDILRPVLRPESVDPMKEYQSLGVRLDGGGPYLRETNPGSQIASKTLFRVKAGDFIYSRLFAWRGAFGVVPAKFHNCYVSSEFPTFQPAGGRIDVEFLRLWFGLPATLTRVEADCTGSTPLTRNRFKEEFFSALEIPLPPLDEQRRIVARVEQLAAKIEEARHTQVDVMGRCDALCRSMIFSKSRDVAVPTAMGTFVKLREPDIDVQRGGLYSFAGVYCFGKGLFSGATKSGMEFEYSRLTRLRTGDFVYPKLMAWEGALGVVPPDCDGLVVSPEFPVFEIDQSRALPETLDVYFRTPSVWPHLAEISTGTNVRRRRLHPSAFLRFQMPLPKMRSQLKLREVKRRVDTLKHLQAEAAAELDALLPSILDRAFRGDL